MRTDWPIITLDGPSGVGKSTLAALVAENLDWAFLDTGATFRAVALELGEGAWDWPEDELYAALRRMRFELTGQGENSKILLNGQQLLTSIREEKVGMWASLLSKRPEVRKFLLSAQRKMARTKEGEFIPLVAEGRDMGTLVFPLAAHKFFLEATPMVRAQRRLKQLFEGQTHVPAEVAAQKLKQISADMEKRDYQDRTRALAPLRPADDAMIIDVTLFDCAEVLKIILNAVTAKKDYKTY